MRSTYSRRHPVSARGSGKCQPGLRFLLKRKGFQVFAAVRKASAWRLASIERTCMHTLSRLTVLGILLHGTAAFASPTAECIGLRGMSYYLDEGFVEDGMGGANIVLFFEDGRFDIGIGDVAGARRVGEDGGRVQSHVDREKALVVVMVVYPDLSGVETYTFDLRRQKLVLTQARAGGIFPRSGIYEAPCAFRRP